MNCKQGDLAIVVKSTSGNEGKIVRCIDFVGSIEVVTPTGIEVGMVWQVDRKLHCWNGMISDHAFDYQLRPIRDPGDNAVDETLLRIPSPRQPVEA